MTVAQTTALVTQAAWMLTAAFVLSLVYELYRATAKTGTSPHDSPKAFVKDFSAGVAGASIFYYNPKVILERRPGFVDWFEDLVFTGLLILAAALLVYQVLGVTLEP